MTTESVNLSQAGFENTFEEADPLEVCVLGLLWVDFPNDAAMQTIDAHWFFDLTNRRLFQYIRELRERGRQADTVACWNELTTFEKKRLWGEGVEKASSSVLLPTYTGMLRQRYLEAMTAKLLKDTQGRMTADERKKLKQLLDESDSNIESSFATAKDIMPKVLETIERRRQYGMEMPTGYPLLDAKTDGLHKGQLWIVGAYTSVGKTIFLTSVAHLLFRREKRVLYFTTEMPKDEYLRTRLIPAFSGLHALKVKAGNLTDADVGAVITAGSRLSALPFWINDNSFPSLQDIRKTVRQIRPDVLFLDHIHRCSMPDADNRNLALTIFVSGLKTLAREENIPIVAAAQLNRNSQADDTPPSLAHLRDSGSLEMESDVVLLLSRRTENKIPTKEIKVTIAKNRHGDLGVIEMELDGPTLLMQEKDVPREVL